MLAATAIASRAADVPHAERSDWEPGYVKLERAGVLKRRVQQLLSIYHDCHLCPRDCRVDRTVRKRGVCHSGARARVHSAHAHFGEEQPLVGTSGSGAIFFANCGLRCCFCQNWEIAHRGDGEDISDEALARMMIGLQERGCHNINLVTPTHYVPSIVSAVRIAAPMGLRLPLVYNCGGYESISVLKLLDGIVDIYLPDFKYADSGMAAKYSSGARNYPELAAEAIAEMHRQVGELVVDDNGVALHGLMIRHLVLPDNIANTGRIARWVAENLTPSTYVNIMGQYHPAYRACEHPQLARRITFDEYAHALRGAQEAGLTRLDRG